MHFISRSLPLLLIMTISTSCKTGSVADATSSADSLTLMTFNVENLFDNIDDPGKSDETYLPASKKQSKAHKQMCAGYRYKKWRDQCLNWDWSDNVVETKLARLGQAISQVKNGLGPDILVLQEVENQRILKRLRDEKLSKSGYQSLVLIEGNDRRGIDIAILSRLKQIGQAKLHPIAFKGFGKDRTNDTRGILQADFELPGGKTLTVFGCHFPAPFHPTEMRIQAFKALQKLQKDLPKDRLFMAAGDFNVTAEEDRNKKLLSTFVEKDWLVSHKIGCLDCPGTQYYPPKKSWSFLDMVLLSKNFNDSSSSWKVLPKSVRLINGAPEQKREGGFPKAFRLPKASGVSDHWPIAVDIIDQS